MKFTEPPDPEAVADTLARAEDHGVGALTRADINLLVELASYYVEGPLREEKRILYGLPDYKAVAYAALRIVLRVPQPDDALTLTTAAVNLADCLHSYRHLIPNTKPKEPNHEH